MEAEDAYLEIPWHAGVLRYYDLKRHPELLLELPESHNREMAEFLTAMNSALSMVETAKCDAWLSNQMEEQEALYATSWKFGSYVDLIFTDPKARLGFAGHENFAKRSAALLRRAPDAPAAEFIIRRCRYAHGAAGGEAQPGGSSNPAEGFYLTFYLFGYGDDEDEARRRWGIALKTVENALLQLSALHRRGSDQTAAPPAGTMRALQGAG